LSNPGEMSTDELRLKLANGAQQLGIALTDEQSDRLLTLLSELQDWNSRFNLTAIRDPVDVVVKHLLDSLSVFPYLRGRTAADVGSGAGFPGLPLAIVSPERQFALIEATTKKAKFLEHVVARLGLTNVAVINSRAERYRPPTRFDCVLARALGNLSEFVRVAGHLCAPRGRLLAMKGKAPKAEIDDLPQGWHLAALHRLRIPGLEAERHLVELERSASRS
jgi:16S rRNA (guanine527-N7)-methyltransferase